MIPELGQLCLLLALTLSVVQASVPVLQKFAGIHRIMGLTRPIATLVFLLVATAFAALIYSYAVSDFSVLNVVENSHTSKPLLYKITGAWGNHEGSMLLWMLVLGSCGFMVAFLTPADRELQAMTLAVMGFISAGFLAFIIFTSNPFLRIWPIPTNGEDLNPILQDIGLAFHPPTLYVGYVGFGVAFAYAMAALILNRMDAVWARTVQPWILFPWSALTLGIGAGAWWAYRELGWGGWWFWDPVENVSLLPWLAGTALLHSNLVLERRGKLARWVALLAILTFTLSLIGTFIVRSGLITSVHAFASDPTRGIYILMYIFAVSGAALFLYARAALTPSGPIALLSRSGMILANNLLLLAGTGTILLAILYPIFLQLTGSQSVSVGPGYYTSSFLPLMAPLPFLAALGPLIGWDRSTPRQLRTQIIALAPALLIAGVIALALTLPQMLLGFTGLALACWLGFGTFRYAHRQFRARALASRQLAAFLAHLGLAVLVFGITLSSFLKQTYEAPLVPNQVLQFGDFTLRLMQVDRAEHDNYITRAARFQVEERGKVIAHLTPELRTYPVRAMQTTEAALYSTPLRDIYLVLGDSTGDGISGIGVRMYVTPGQQLIWFGFILAALGAGISLAGRLKEKQA